MREIRIQATDLFNRPLAGQDRARTTGLRFAENADAVQWIVQEQSRFEDRGYNRLHGYWWAQGRNDSKRYRWWIVEAAALAA